MNLVAVVGPTATGKSDLALDLAEALGGPSAVEIVNADAFQLYRGMDIGTAKLPWSERRGVTHHQIDVLNPDQDASVAHYQKSARQNIADAATQLRRSLVVGGSGLYLRALLDDLQFPGIDTKIRARWEARAEAEGVAPLYDILTERDPAAAAAIGSSNTRRIVRALEVIELTGRPFSATLPRQEYVSPCLQIGLDYGREILDERIEQRVDHMWQSGLSDEVARLAGPSGEGLGRTAARAVGYPETLAFLRGEASAEQTRAAISAATRRLSRKQMGWFGRDQRVHWIRADQVTGTDLRDQALALIESFDRDGTVGASSESRRSLGS